MQTYRFYRSHWAVRRIRARVRRSHRTRFFQFAVGDRRLSASGHDELPRKGGVIPRREFRPCRWARVTEPTQDHSQTVSQSHYTANPRVGLVDAGHFGAVVVRRSSIYRQKPQGGCDR